MSPDLMVTLWPSFPHYSEFAGDFRLSGIRLNSAMISCPDLGKELEIIRATNPTVPNYFDVKGRQLRVTEVIPNANYLDFRVNHPIRVQTPVVVYLKAGTDAGLLGEVSENGHRLTFIANPKFSVRAGESLHIKDPSFSVGGAIFTDLEKEKIAKVVSSGLIDKWFISYVEDTRDLDEFRELVGRTTEIMLKIESKAGLQYATTKYIHQPGLRLVAACGDLFVEVDAPHKILKAVEHIIAIDPEAVVGSRMFLSVCRGPSSYLKKQVQSMAERYPEASKAILAAVRESDAPHDPDFADWAQLAYLHKIGYRSFMLCDELCLRGDMLHHAVNAFDAFRTDYVKAKP